MLLGEMSSAVGRWVYYTQPKHVLLDIFTLRVNGIFFPVCEPVTRYFSSIYIYLIAPTPLSINQFTSTWLTRSLSCHLTWASADAPVIVTSGKNQQHDSYFGSMSFTNWTLV